MNKFIAGKMGEVLAFARIGADTLTKGKKGFAKMLKKSEIQFIGRFFKTLEAQVLILAKEEGAVAGVEKEAAKAQKKVTTMRNTYIGRKWDETDELLEWMGFYTGAALVHWYLIAGAAKASRLTDLLESQQRGNRLLPKLVRSRRKEAPSYWRSRGTIEPPWIDLERIADTVTYLEVHVRTGRIACAADIADNLSLDYLFARDSRDFRHMSIERLRTIVVVYNHILAIAPVPS